MYPSARAACCLLIVLSVIACENKEIPSGASCSQTPLNTPTASTTNASSCTASDGQVEVTATGGIAPYKYSINNGAFQDSPVFAGLSAGTYPITVKDSRDCTVEDQVTVLATGSTLSATAITGADGECFPPHNGTITISPSGGTPPYEVKLGNGAFGAGLSFSALEMGAYTVSVKDADNCIITLGLQVPRGDTGVSFASEVNPIIGGNCAVAGCHVAGTGRQNFTTYSGIAANAQSIKIRTSNGSMPPSPIPDLSAEQKQLIACWVDDGAKNN